MPGIETRAPERTDTRKGSGPPPNVLPAFAATCRQGGLDLRLQPIGKSPAASQIVPAHRGGDGQPRRYGQADPAHRDKVGALAAQNGLVSAFRRRHAGRKTVDPFCVRARVQSAVSCNAPCYRIAT